jgi:hypothetical protein
LDKLIEATRQLEIKDLDSFGPEIKDLCLKALGESSGDGQRQGVRDNCYLQSSSRFSVTEEEFDSLTEALGRLCHKAAWEVIKSYRNEEQENIAQELSIALIRSAAQYKRKNYFARAFQWLEEKGHIDSPFVACWKDLFDTHKMTHEEEEEFISFMDQIAGPAAPRVDEPLSMDEGGLRYIKTCVWNQQKFTLKNLGKQRMRSKGNIVLSGTEDWIVAPDGGNTAFENLLGNQKRNEIFEEVRKSLKDRSEEAYKTYVAIMDPTDQEDIYHKSSDFKFKLGGIRRKTRQSYETIRSSLSIIEDEVGEKLSSSLK